MNCRLFSWNALTTTLWLYNDSVRRKYIGNMEKYFLPTSRHYKALMLYQNQIYFNMSIKNGLVLPMSGTTRVKAWQATMALSPSK